MNEQQKRLVTMLNDMYHSQSDEYKSRYRDNYFELLQHIISPRAYISGEEIIARINSGSRLFEGRTKQEDSV
jgi:hypothetical protein